ncbi:MAG: DUF2784 family protein [Alphaproteobacteria bacterium]
MWVGITCPLTSLENMLRGSIQSESFIGYWIQQLIYWDLPTHIFFILYCIFLGWKITYVADLPIKKTLPVNVSVRNTKGVE